MSKEKTQNQGKPVNVSFTLEGEDAERFIAYMKRHNLKINAEAGRKALFDQLDAEEGKAA